jgi:hypothetical protein
MIGKFFHTPGTKQFGFRPRYYDPDKEDLDNRIERIKEEMGMAEKKKDNGKPFISNIKGQFRNPDGWQKSSTDARKAQNKRLIYLVIILGLVFFMFFYF